MWMSYNLSLSSYWLLAFCVLSGEAKDFKLIVWNWCSLFYIILIWIQQMDFIYVTNKLYRNEQIPKKTPWQLNSKLYRTKCEQWTLAYMSRYFFVKTVERERLGRLSRAQGIWKFCLARVCMLIKFPKNGVPNRLNHVKSIKITLENIKTETHVASSFVFFLSLHVCMHWRHIHIGVWNIAHERAFARIHEHALQFLISTHTRFAYKLQISLTYGTVLSFRKQFLALGTESTSWNKWKKNQNKFFQRILMNEMV